MDNLQAIATFCSFVGALFIMKRNKWGFMAYNASVVFWTWWAATRSPMAIGLILTQCMFFSLNIISYLEWRKCD